MRYRGVRIHAKSPYSNPKLPHIGYALCGVFRNQVDATSNSLEVTCRKCIYFLLKEGKITQKFEPWSPGTKKQAEKDI